MRWFLAVVAAGIAGLLSFAADVPASAATPSAHLLAVTISPPNQTLTLVVQGIQFGAILAMTAVGLSLVFGTTGLINFAHGELVTLGAVVAFFFNASVAGPGWHLIAAGAMAVLLAGLFGWFLHRVLWQPLDKRKTGLIQMFIISIGLSLLMRSAIQVFFGSDPKSYLDYVLQEQVRYGPIAITHRDLIITVGSLVILVLVALMLQRTRIGKAMRAVADNRDLAEASGIDVTRVVRIVWVLGTALAALGGILYGLTQIVSYQMGFQLLLLIFSGIILGGLGTAYGAMVGSLVIGLVIQLSTLWFPVELENAWALAVLILILVVRPQGILGRRERVG
ncbi:MAG TPA: branched-chain amino acid ABC transporter permease [Jatrophihabitans sp.]|nr:branched-chain amino acid ABC transporter permease [Jatrophihabitans sp.]